MSVAVDMIQFQGQVPVFCLLRPAAFLAVHRFQARIKEPFFELEALDRGSPNQNLGECDLWVARSLETPVPPASLEMASVEIVFADISPQLLVIPPRPSEVQLFENLPVTRGSFYSMDQVF